MAGAAREAQRELTQLSTAGTNELGRMFVELASEQTRQNLETLKALSVRSTGPGSPRQSIGSGCSRSRALTCAPAWSARRS